VVDLYNVDNPTKYQNILEQQMKEPALPNPQSKKNVDNIKLGGFGGMYDGDLIGDDAES
jgi:hypothetical protein